MSRFYHFLFFGLSLMLSNSILGQGIKIIGKVTDAETKEALPNAHIFIDQTTLGVVSDVNGHYVLEGIQDGEVKIVFSYVGYEPYSKIITVSGADISISAQLKPQEEILQNVDVKDSRDKEWEAQLKEFKKVFLGEGEFARACTLSNPWVLEFTYTKATRLFVATASAPLLIENNALGYTIDCTLQEFRFSDKFYKIKGLYRFNEVNTLDAKEATRWTRNRRKAYQSSIRFLLKSIIENNVAENGFQLYYDNRLTFPTTLGSFTEDLNLKNVIKTNMKDNVTPSGRPGVYRIPVNNRLEIHHTNSYAEYKTYRDVSSPVSWIECEGGALLVTKDGYLINYEQVTTSGELNKNRIAQMLPTNYNPGNIVVVNYLTKRNVAKRLQEKVYLHTDKGFYYPGEQLWFKAYMNYANPSVRDSLSTVLYVDIIAPNNSIVSSKFYKINDASAKGDIHLPEKLSPGLYFIRAYTSWMKNYGDENLFYSPFAIVRNNLRIRAKETIEEKEDFLFKTTPGDQSSNDSIHVSISLDSTLQNYFAHCSIAVVPNGESKFPYSPSIKEALSFTDELPDNTLSDFIYPLEYDFSIQGLLTRPGKKNTMGAMNVIQGKLDSIYQFKTDSKGKFKIEHLDFYDTVRFSFQARDKKGRIFGTTQLLTQPKPTVRIPRINLKTPMMDTLLLSTPIAFNSSPSTDTLEAKFKSVSKSTTSKNSSYDYIISKEDLEKVVGHGNLLSLLQQRIPGFQMNQSNRSISLQQGLGGSSSNAEPLIVIDGIPANYQSANGTSTIQQQTQQASTNTQNQSYTKDNDKSQSSTTIQTSTPEIQSPGYGMDILNNISVHDVSQIEVAIKFDPQYGSSGNNGVISIQTDKSTNKRSTQKTFDYFTIEGYANSPLFISPSAEMERLHPCYSPTLFWNPSISVSSKKEIIIKLRAPHRGDPYLLRIEGITNEGKPVAGSIQIAAPIAQHE